MSQEKKLKQLRMIKLNMSDIPEANVFGDYKLRVLCSDEKIKWEEICTKSFGYETDFKKIIEDMKGYTDDGVFGIFDKDKLIATGTALLDQKSNGHGYVHMIAADAGYSGKRLGYEITAAVLRRLRNEGFDKAELTTDDFRLPAIKTYLNLGFIPDLSVDETMCERWGKIFEILGLSA